MPFGDGPFGDQPFGDGEPGSPQSVWVGSETDWEVRYEVGLRGGWVVELEGVWQAPAAEGYTVRFFQLGVYHNALGLPGDGNLCYPRTLALLPVVTPPLTPGLWRIEATEVESGKTVVLQEVLRAMTDDKPWNTFAYRRMSPHSPYRLFGPRRAQEDA